MAFYLKIAYIYVRHRCGQNAGICLKILVVSNLFGYWVFPFLLNTSLPSSRTFRRKNQLEFFLGRMLVDIPRLKFFVKLCRNGIHVRFLHTLIMTRPHRFLLASYLPLKSFINSQVLKPVLVAGTYFAVWKVNRLVFILLFLPLI